MRLYELVLILKSSLQEEKRKKVLEALKKLLNNAKITKEDIWGQKALAYPIKSEQSGYYYLLSFEVQDVLPNDFEKKLLMQEDIIRHLLLRKK